MDNLEKLSVLTTIPLNTFERLSSVINCVHSDTVVTQMVEGKDYFELDIIEGKIYVKLEDDVVRYKFIPNEEFDEIIKNSIITKRSKLVETSLDRLKRSLANTYKDIF
jgi:hypothetical protein